MKTYTQPKLALVEGRRMSNNEVAKLTGLHFTAISRLRSARRVPEYQTIRDICDGLNLPAEWRIEWVRRILQDGATGSAEFLREILG